MLAPAVGYFANKVGAVWCVLCSSIALVSLFVALPYVSTAPILMLLAALLGCGLVLFSVADLSLIIQTLPDEDFTGSDIGIWNM